MLPQQEQGQSKVYQAGQCLQCGEDSHFTKNCPLLKRKDCFKNEMFKQSLDSQAQTI